MQNVATLVGILLLVGASVSGMAQPSGHQEHHAVQQASPAKSEGPPMFRTPQSIATEHHELHETLARAAKEGGELGRSAIALEQALAPHFKREEEIATPPLGLLPSLAHGDATREMRAVLPMTEALERELPQMLREHELIRKAVSKFRSVADRDGKQAYVRFADALAAHARQEEEILYPAAILVGRHVAGTAPK